MKIVLDMAMTVNGMIARENDEAPWSEPIWKNYYKVAKGFKVIIIGRRTYEMMLGADEFKKIGNPFTIVLTNTKIKPRDKFVFVDSLEKALAVAKRKKFTKVFIGGGNSVNSLFMKHNLVDEVYLDIEPMAMGKGVKLFEGDFECKMKLIKASKLSKDILHLEYKVVK